MSVEQPIPYPSFVQGLVAPLVQRATEQRDPHLSGGVLAFLTACYELDVVNAPPRENMKHDAWFNNIDLTYTYFLTPELRQRDIAESLKVSRQDIQKSIAKTMRALWHMAPDDVRAFIPEETLNTVGRWGKIQRPVGQLT